jgi:signal transduction histidine kinase
LKGIVERARLLGGSARIDSEPGKGTRIDVVLPLSGFLG